MSGRRRNLWARAEALDLGEDPTLSPRARRIAARVGGGPPLEFADVAEAPEWAAWPADEQARLALLAGAVAVGGAWRRSVDGPLLRRAGDAVGETFLDAVLTLPDADDAIGDAAAREGDRDALLRLGRAALLGELADRPALAERLSRLADARPWPEAAFAAATARGLIVQLGANA